jgi:hypothetical protein
MAAVEGGGVQLNFWSEKGGWVGWHPLSHGAATDITCSSPAPGQLDCFILSADCVITHRAWQTSGWSSSTSIQGPAGATVGIAAQSHGGPRPALAALTADGIAYYLDGFPNGPGEPEWHLMPR